MKGIGIRHENGDEKKHQWLPFFLVNSVGFAKYRKPKTKRHLAGFCKTHLLTIDEFKTDFLQKTDSKAPNVRGNLGNRQKSFAKSSTASAASDERKATNNHHHQGPNAQPTPNKQSTKANVCTTLLPFYRKSSYVIYILFGYYWQTGLEDLLWLLFSFKLVKKFRQFHSFVAAKNNSSFVFSWEYFLSIYKKLKSRESLSRLDREEKR